MPQTQMNITIENRSGIRTNFSTKIRKNVLDEYRELGFTIISVQY